LTLQILGRTQRRAVVVIGAAIPVAIPAVGFERGAHCAGLLPIADGLGLVASPHTEDGEIGERGVEEPAQPDAFALAFDADTVHAVVPVAAAHQGDAMRAGGGSPVQSPLAMLIEREGLVRRRKVGVALFFVVGQGFAL
jgi:hypothetical protein